MGKEKLSEYLRKHHLEMPKDKELLECAKSFTLKSLDSFYAGLGSSDISLVTAVNRLYPQLEETEEISLEDAVISRTRPKGGIKIDDINMLQFNFGKCCQPVPGEDIVGFITRGRGITVHRKDCPNITRSNIDEERIVELDWDITAKSSFIIQINFVMEDRPGILRDVLNSISDDDTNLKDTSISASRGLARGEFIAEVKNLTHLNNLINRIRRVKGVIDVTRKLGSSRSKK